MNMMQAQTDAGANHYGHIWNDNWLDYHLLPIAVHADLEARPQYRTGLVGGLRNIDNVIGGALGYNFLLGNDHDNILVAFRRSNVLYGLNGNDLLIGGQLVGQVNPFTGKPETSKNYLYGGAGEDIIVPGSTIYDTSVPDLERIREIWATPGNVLARAALLLPDPNGHASGPVFAQDQTVFVNNVSPAPGPNGTRIFSFEQSIVFGGPGFNFVVAGYAAIIMDLKVVRIDGMPVSEGWETFSVAFKRKLNVTLST
jgi:hypothetical protein